MTLPDHLLRRLLWLIFGIGFGGLLIAEGLLLRQLGMGLSGVGLALLGIAWFLDPKAGGQALGPKALHPVLVYGGLGLLGLGLVLRYLVKV